MILYLGTEGIGGNRKVGGESAGREGLMGRENPASLAAMRTDKGGEEAENEKFEMPMLCYQYMHAPETAPRSPTTTQKRAKEIKATLTKGG